MLSPQPFTARPGGYELHHLDLPDLNLELRLAWRLGLHRALERWTELGITNEIGNHLQLGALPIFTEGRLFRPFRADDDADRVFWASVKATRWINGLPFDLIAISMEPAGWWLRRGEEEWLGELGDSPHHTKVLAWLRSGGKGSCWIGGCHGG
jgi:hypothetical protein